ncbi:hypothetical protein BH20ACT16_BH20ACT16_12940 [soil metagenome]|jgi:hypothetical protein
MEGRDAEADWCGADGIWKIAKEILATKSKAKRTKLILGLLAEAGGVSAALRACGV